MTLNTTALMTNLEDSAINIVGTSEKKRFSLIVITI